MRRTPVLRLAGLCTAAAVAALLVPGSASAVPGEVDESRLVPSVSGSSFAPFDCTLKRTGPVCTGERHLRTDWEEVDWCEVPLFVRTVSDRFQTRYYDNDYLNYDRRFRTRDIDSFSLSSGGPTAATISVNVRFQEPFAVRGDDSTFTVITDGVLWDIRGAQGRPLFHVVGTLVEPPGGEELATFTGHVTEDGRTTRYVDEPLSTFSSEEKLFSLVCEAATR